MTFMNMKHLLPTVALFVATLPVLSAVAQGAAAPAATNHIVRWLNARSLPHLDATQAEAYAQENQRRPEALLGVYQASTDRVFLREAMTKHPRDARVAFVAACTTGSAQASPDGPQERRQWLDAFKKSAPDNALAWHLSARDHFKTGQPDIAEKEALAGAGKPVITPSTSSRTPRRPTSRPATRKPKPPPWPWALS